MLTFTLDTNCIISVDKGEPAGLAVRKLADAHKSGYADVSLVAVSSSELQKGKTYLVDYHVFLERIHRLGLDHLNIIFGLAYSDISFYDVSLCDVEEESYIEEAVHSAMFPNIPFAWADFAKEKNLDLESITAKSGRKWRNAWCDRQLFWAHQHAQRDIFVTSNMSDFGRIKNIPMFSAARIMKPDEAAALVSS